MIHGIFYFVSDSSEVIKLLFFFSFSSPFFSNLHISTILIIFLNRLDSLLLKLWYDIMIFIFRKFSRFPDFFRIFPDFLQIFRFRQFWSYSLTDWIVYFSKMIWWFSFSGNFPGFRIFSGYFRISFESSDFDDFDHIS